jgi:hypothetical protein
MNLDNRHRFSLFAGDSRATSLTSAPAPEPLARSGTRASSAPIRDRCTAPLGAPVTTGLSPQPQPTQFHPLADPSVRSCVLSSRRGRRFKNPRRAADYGGVNTPGQRLSPGARVFLILAALVLPGLGPAGIVAAVLVLGAVAYTWRLDARDARQHRHMVALLTRGLEREQDGQA